MLDEKTSLRVTDQPVAPGVPARFSFKKKLTFTLVLALLVTFLGLGVLELYVRRTSALGYITPEILRDRSLQYVPSLFARSVFPRKALRAYGGEGPNGSIYYDINEKGYRGHDFEPKKPAGKTRLIFYGGSHVFDILAPEAEDWPHRVERNLIENGFPQVEVINAGVPGHASFDSLGMLWSEGHVFQPDYVIFCGAWNDIKKHFPFNEPLLRQMRPYVEDGDPRLNYQSGIDRFLCEHSQLYVRARQKYYEWKVDADLEGKVVRNAPKFDFAGQEEALKQYKLNVQLFVDCAHDIGAVPVLIPEARLSVGRDTANRTGDVQARDADTEESLLSVYERIEQILKDVAREKNAFLLELSMKLNGRPEFFSDRVHLTERGSGELAALVAQEMIRLLEQRK